MILPSSDGTFDLTPDMIQSLRLKYPHTDVDKELALIHLWLHRNPSRRWTRTLSGVEAWFKRVEAKQVQKGAKLHIVTTKQSAEWWATDATTIAYGERNGKPARPGETMADYRRRLRSA